MFHMVSKRFVHTEVYSHNNFQYKETVRSPQTSSNVAERFPTMFLRCANDRETMFPPPANHETVQCKQIRLGLSPRHLRMLNFESAILESSQHCFLGAQTGNDLLWNNRKMFPQHMFRAHTNKETLD